MLGPRSRTLLSDVGLSGLEASAYAQPVVGSPLPSRHDDRGSVLLAAAATPTGQQAPPQSAPAEQPAPGRQRPETPMKPDRARRSSTSATSPTITPAATTSRRTWTQKAPSTSATPEASQGVMDFQKINYRSSVGDMDIPAYLFQPLQEARTEGARGDGLGARRRPRQLGHQHVPVRQGSRRARLRRDLSGVSRQHRLRRGAPHGDRLRRLRDRRRAERRRLPEDAAARRSGPARA